MGNNSKGIGGSSLREVGSTINENTRLSSDDEINDVAHTLVTNINESFYEGEPFSLQDAVKEMDNFVDFLEVDDPSVGLSGAFPDDENKRIYRDYITDEDLVYEGLEALADAGVLARSGNSELNGKYNGEYYLNMSDKDIQEDIEWFNNEPIQRTMNRTYNPLAYWEPYYNHNRRE